MKGIDESKKKKKIIYIFLILLVILSLIISIVLNLSYENEEESETETNVTVIENNSLIVKELQDMGERDRMEYYFGTFLEYVEDDEYSKAYNLLNSDFKENYFPTLEKFEEYCDKTFSEMMNIKHENIERNGDVYVLWITISDAINGTPGDEKEMNIVIKENDYYDFEMSFSVI